MKKLLSSFLMKDWINECVDDFLYSTEKKLWEIILTLFFKAQREKIMDLVYDENILNRIKSIFKKSAEWNSLHIPILLEKLWEWEYEDIKNIATLEYNLRFDGDIADVYIYIEYRIWNRSLKKKFYVTTICIDE